MEREFSNAPDQSGTVTAEQRQEQLLNVFLQAAVEYVREHPAFAADQLHDYLTTRYSIKLDAAKLTDDLYVFMSHVAEWQASLGTPLEFTILSSPAEEQIYRINDGRTIVHTPYGDTFAVKDAHASAYIAPVKMTASAIRALPQPMPEALPGHKIDPAFTKQELKIAEVALKRLSWQTAREGVLAPNLEKWLVEPEFSERAVVVLIERLHRRGLIITVDGRTEVPLLALRSGAGVESINELRLHAQIKLPEDEA